MIIQSKYTIYILDLTWNKNKPILKNEKMETYRSKKFVLIFRRVVNE